MKSVVSTTHDHKYLFFLPIITWCWNNLGVDVICFMPFARCGGIYNYNVGSLLEKVREDNGLRFGIYPFECPEHKEATYAQCSRLYASALGLPEDEVLITSDVDMGVFKIPITEHIGRRISILGFDLVPDGQVPMCYAAGTVEGWKQTMKIESRTPQQCLDDLLMLIEADHFRGNYWSKDQEELNNKLHESHEYILIPRARHGTQFATNRLDRDDAFLLDRLSPDIIDFHMPRPGYEENNFNQILTVLQYFYPNDNFDWLINYRNEYIKLL